MSASPPMRPARLYSDSPCCGVGVSWRFVGVKKGVGGNTDSGEPDGARSYVEVHEVVYYSAL